MERDWLCVVVVIHLGSVDVVLGYVDCHGFLPRSPTIGADIAAHAAARVVVQVTYMALRSMALDDIIAPIAEHVGKLDGERDSNHGAAFGG
jgi:hypothetical protein